MAPYNKLRGGTIVNLVGELKRLGFKFEFQKYPEMRNKWKVVFECPAGSKANFSTVIGSNDEMLKISDALRMGGKTFLFNLSVAVGRFGENAMLAAVRAGRINHTFRVGGQSFNLRNMTLSAPLQLQNTSGNGLDLVAKITAPRPPAPRWVAFEVKSKMGPDVPFPSLSEAQQRSDYVQRAAEGAFAGIEQAQRAIRRNQTRGRSWEDLIPQKAEVEEFRDAAQDSEVIKIHAKVELDRMGQPVGEIELVAW
ncbi:hypothetical protein [Jannaschia pohangensis]|uniref:Uncharacterized protein n=1 Tax=Jannaschia pohangensis TaxID=390807 RepID=A0A1I3P421_9RHOB|nr:hypothetical protein [Jannaschia pohangensis]SFJ16077.1 hypothetical protein SAMN04488095_2334 [Jannaschia pohangensis]